MQHRAFVFTVHKAASLGLHEVIRQVARKEGWPFYSPNRKVPNMVEPEAPGDPEFFAQFEGKTGLIGPVRMPVEIPDAARERDRFIVHLRDPRDVLVSMFFSWGYSHPGINPEYRSALRDEGVDQFVLRESPGLKKKYDLYFKDFLSMPQTALLKYEDFVLDRPHWLEQFLSALEIPNGRRRYQSLAKDNPASQVKSEDIYRHIRKAAPGDFRDKLSGETIEALNHQWKDGLERLGYDV